MSSNEMKPKPTIRERLVEWFVSHALWEAAKFLLGSAISTLLLSWGVVGITHGSTDTVEHIFLVVFGTLGIAWSVGLLPLRKGDKESLSSLRNNLGERCGHLIIEWQKLDQLYQNSQKEPGQPATLQQPMSVIWRSAEIKYLPYQVGVLQGYTHVLLRDLQTIGIPIEPWDDRISMPELLEALRTYRERIAHSAAN